MKFRFLYTITFSLFFPFLLWGQGAYYNTIDTGSVNFVTELHNLIYPHTQISYNNYKTTIIPDFESRDTTEGHSVVTCVYSGQNYIYTPPFAWIPFSREHTWCHSWMPTYNSESGKEYSDQHHLFPTNQDNANGVRSNHPLGIVVTPTGANGTFLNARYGTNSNGEIVYEPRNSHKGDAARAIMYMAVCYNGVNAKDWSFNYLNTVTLPALNEASQSVDLLIQWHNQDPPDQWEKDRNEYIYSIQGNRNPFIDHPEYVGVIDFNTLTKKTSSASGEPTNYPVGYNAPTVTSNSIKITWNDPSGDILPTGYLLKANTSDSFTDPIDGNEYADQSNLSSGTAQVNIPFGSGQYTFTGLPSSTLYYFKLFPYNGNTTLRYYKTDSFPSALDENYSTGSESSGSGPTDLYFSEYIEGSSNNKAIELFNGTASSINLTSGAYKIEIYFNGSSTVGSTINLTGSISSGGVFIVGHTSAGIGITSLSNMTSGNLNFNGDDVVVLKKGSVTVDIIGQMGFDPGTEWGSGVQSTADNTLVRKSSVSSGDTNPNDIFDPSSEWDGYATDSFGNLGIHAGILLPVELISFTALVHQKNVVLNWETAAEINNYRFEIEKSRIQNSEFRIQNKIETWVKVGFVDGSGTTNSPNEYTFFDKNLSAGTYSYRLKQIDRDGKYEYSHSVEVTITGAPKEYSLEQNYPNPFNPTTMIRYQLPVTNHVTLRVYDAIGREVATLVNEVKEAGDYSVPFYASQLSSGIYFAKLQSGEKLLLKKMMLIR